MGRENTRGLLKLAELVQIIIIWMPIKFGSILLDFIREGADYRSSSHGKNRLTERINVKIDELSLEKAKNMPIGATATWADGKTYKK